VTTELYWHLFSIYTTGLVIETIYTLCDKISKAYIFLKRLTILDWLELTFMPMIWPVIPLYKLFSTITDAQQVIAAVQSSDEDDVPADDGEEVWAT
jgi:hypothetical protein